LDKKEFKIMFITLRGEVLPTAQATVSFKWAELACKCGCRTAYVEEEALEKLQQLRDFLGKPITINSASRCPIHNAKVGGAPKSQHRSTETSPSTAFDILLGNLDKEEVISAARAVGFKGLGINYKTFVHVDNRDTLAIW
jgi:zinc D-Ala-D-Ala carboxypeptidase